MLKIIVEQFLIVIISLVLLCVGFSVYVRQTCHDYFIAYNFSQEGHWGDGNILYSTSTEVGEHFDEVEKIIEGQLQQKYGAFTTVIITNFQRVK